MQFRDTAEQYRRVALRRLEDAHELMEVPTRNPARSDAKTRHIRGAVYLSGYAIECLLKSYLIKQWNAQTLNEAVELLDKRRAHQGQAPVENIIRTAAGHRLVYLLQITDLITYNAYDEQLWGRLAQWRSAWRYETDEMTRADADGFMDDVQRAADWLLPLTT